MNYKRLMTLNRLAVLAGLWTSLNALAAPSTAFTYQGRLVEGANPANGNYDFQFQLATAESGSTQFGPALTKNDELVTNGLFTVELDFGSNPFKGDNYWLDIAVRLGSETGNYTTLAPRQALTPVPYAIFAATASSATSVPWTALTGVPTSASEGYSAGAGLTLTGTRFSITTAGVINSMLAASAVTGEKISQGQVVRSLNGQRDDLRLIDGDNIRIKTLGTDLQASAFDLWKVTGNSGTTAVNFLGTLDNQPVDFRVNSARALRLQPAAGTPNLIGGDEGNYTVPGVFGAVIGGGGADGANNRVTDQFGTIGGGMNNQAGNSDGIASVGRFATVGGGHENLAGGEWTTVTGGHKNAATLELATVGGGGFNVASGYASVVSGGGGYSASLDRTIPNQAFGFWSVIGGGADNTVTNEYGVIAGGGNNKAGEIYAAIGGGKDNTVSGKFATVPGGRQNLALGDTSLAAGFRAKAEHEGAFVWADSNAVDFRTVTSNEFAVRALGGVRFVSAVDLMTGVPRAGVELLTGSGSWSSLSDRNAKENLSAVDGRQVLEKLAALPIQTWNYKTQAPSVRHIGVMAQDFAAAFQVGEDERHISSVDADGVALAAIKGLYQVVQEKDASMRKKEAEIESLKARLTVLEKLVSNLANKK